MCAPWIATSRAGLPAVAAALLLAAACGDSGTQSHGVRDAAPDVRADADDGGAGGGSALSDGGDASDDVVLEAPLDSNGEGPDSVAGDPVPPADAPAVREAPVRASPG